MADNKGFNLISFLLTLVVGLVAFFGTVSVNYLGKMNDALNAAILTSAVQQNTIVAMQKDQQEIKGFYQETIRLFAKKEDEFTIKPQQP